MYNKMKKSIYIILSFIGFLGLNACSDDDVPGNPIMELKTENTDAFFGDSLTFTINASDHDVPLSTLKVQLFYGEEQVSETTIRTKLSGNDYNGKIYIPYYANIPDGKGTLKYILQNINFVISEHEREISLARPDFPYLTLIDEEGKSYKMERESLYKYNVSGDFSQKMNAYIKTPKVGENGNELTFGWENNAIEIGSVTPIPFSNTTPGNYTISFNTLNYEVSPFSKLKVNGQELELIENDIYSIQLTIRRNETLTFEGVPDYDNWWIDPDYFEKQGDGTLKFLPLTGSYQLTANGKKKFFSVMALKDGQPASLQEDGSGAICAIGNGIGKPSVSTSEVGWNASEGLCMAQLTSRKYQLTLTAGVTMKIDNIDFKFFHINDGDKGEFTGEALSTTSNLIEITESGNLKLAEGKKFDRGGVYKFIVDVSGGINQAKLSVEKIDQIELPMEDILINGVKLEETGMDTYEATLDLSQEQILQISGVDDFDSWYLDPDFVSLAGNNQMKFLPVTGAYRIRVNIGMKAVSVIRMDGNKDATLGADGHGAIWIMGWGIGSPSLDNQFGWEPGQAYCMAEISPKKYQFTGIAGPEKDSEIGQRIRFDYLSCKFFHQNGWGAEFSGDNALTIDEKSKVFIADKGNIEFADGVKLKEGEVYVLTIDLTAGNDRGLISFVPK